MTATIFKRWFDDTVVDLGRQMRWSYLPPLMVYLAAGISGLTSIVGTFFVKDYLDLSAAFLAGLTFWVGLPWVLKMPVGHLVDLIWRWKAVLVYFGAALIALSLLIMYFLIAHTAMMTAIAPAEAWYVASVILAPTGYVLQDVVADAMTVEAVPTVDERGAVIPEAQVKAMHITMQTLGRFSIIGGFVLVSALNITMFAGVELLSEAEKVAIYARIYLIALAIPAISVAGVVLGGVSLRWRARKLRRQNISEADIAHMLFANAPADTKPNWWLFGGSLVFVVFTLGMGIGNVPFAQEIILAGSLSIIFFLMYRLLLELQPGARRMLVGTAIVIFMYRAVPLPGPGATWFQIDVLGFDQHFLSILSLITASLTLFGMVVLRPLMATKPIVFIVVLLTIAAGVLLLPNIGLYYGIHHWTSGWSGGIVDARFIAIIDTALESPLGQIAMIPMLAWIARNAPPHLKATFFAVMASFSNLALSTSALATKYVNEVFVIAREVRDRATDVIEVPADYSELGWLLISVGIITTTVPLLTILIVQRSRFHTDQ